MLKFILAAAFTLAAHTAFAGDWIVKDSANDTNKTADQLVAAIEKAGAKVMARVDHAAGAEAVGMTLEPTILVMFGNPKIGTPIITADRRAGLDLPIRVLIWEEAGKTKLGYENPADLKARYGIAGADKAFEAMTGALDKLTGMAIVR